MSIEPGDRIEIRQSGEAGTVISVGGADAANQRALVRLDIGQRERSIRLDSLRRPSDD